MLLEEKKEWKELAEQNGNLLGRIEELEAEVEVLKSKNNGETDSIHLVGK